MQIRPLSSVSCALLHDRFAPVDGEQLMDFLNLAAARAGYAGGAVIASASTERNVAVHVDGVRVTVRQVAQPLSPKSLAAALDYPVTHQILPEAKAIADRHVASTLVSVERPRDGEEAGEHEHSDPTAFDDWQQALRAMVLCLLTADYVAGKNRASAVHWRPSDHLVPQSVLRKAAQEDDRRARYGLLVRAHLLRHGDGDGEADGPPGIEAAGAEQLIGVPVRVDPANVPYDWMAERAADFIWQCHERGTIVPEGERVGEGEAELVRVDHVPPSDEQPAGQVRLVAVRSQRYGIAEPDEPAEADRVLDPLAGAAGAALDPDDEIDQAILTLLAERKRRSAAAEPDPAAAAASEEQRVAAGPVPFRSEAERDAPDEAETRAARRPAMALAELRRIANGGTVPAPRDRVPAPQDRASEPPRFERPDAAQAVGGEAMADAPGMKGRTDRADEADPSTQAEPVAAEPSEPGRGHRAAVPEAEPVAFEALADPGHQAGLLRGILAKLRRRTIRSAA